MRKTKSLFADPGQTLVEMALILPIVLLLVFGVFELGRVVFIFSALNNASREAARFGAASGTTSGSRVQYLDCAAIRERARETALLAGLRNSEIQIAYETPVTATGTMAVYAQCGDSGLDESDVREGDRIVVTITRDIEPIISLLPLPTFSPTFVTARTILKGIIIGPVECSDGVDNDGDGFVDYREDGTGDPGCDRPSDTAEAFCWRLDVSTNPIVGGNLGVVPGSNCANRYIEQTWVDLTASPAEGYTFRRWTGDAGGTTPSTRLQMTSDKTVIAEFRRLTSDLRVTKTGPSTVLAETPMTYRIIVDNPYTDTARTVVLTDTLPAGVDYQGNWSSNDASATCDEVIADTQIVCTVPSIMASTTDQVTFDIELISPGDVDLAPRTITNTVSLSAFEFDPNLANNTSVVTTTVEPRSELTLHRKIGPDSSILAGEEFDYSVVVGNSGPSIATGVVIRDPLPAGVSFVPPAVPSVNNCNNDDNPGIVVCPIGQLTVGETVTRTFRVQAPPNGKLVPNTAYVSGNEDELDIGDNSKSVETEVISHANLSLAKSAPDTAMRDVPFPYTLIITNPGPSDALNVTITDTLPAGLQYNSVSGIAGASCTQSGSTVVTVVCSLGTIAADTTPQLLLNVTPTEAGTFTNMATAGSSTLDQNLGNNTATSNSTTVTTDVNVVVDKSGPAEVMVGELITYTVSVTNLGASRATNLRIIDTLPDLQGWPFEYVGTNAAGWACSGPTGRYVECVRANDLMAGASDSLDIVIRPLTARLYTNEATVTSAENTSGDTHSHGTRVLADFLSLTVSAPVVISNSNPFEYTVTVTNSLRYNAGQVSVISILDPNVTFGSVVPPSGTDWNCGYDASIHRVVCSVDPMVSGPASFTITVTPSLAGTVTVQGYLSGPRVQYDNYTDNNLDSETVTVQ